MSFPSYMWSNAFFLFHRRQFWYVLQDLNLVDLDIDLDMENPTETYYEMYSDY